MSTFCFPKTVDHTTECKQEFFWCVLYIKRRKISMVTKRQGYIIFILNVNVNAKGLHVPVVTICSSKVNKHA